MAPRKKAGNTGTKIRPLNEDEITVALMGIKSVGLENGRDLTTVDLADFTGLPLGKVHRLLGYKPVKMQRSDLDCEDKRVLDLLVKLEYLVIIRDDCYVTEMGLMAGLGKPVDSD